MNQLLAKLIALSVIVIGFQCSSSSDDPQPAVTSQAPPCQIKNFGSVRAGGQLFKQDTVIYSYSQTRISKAKYGVRWSSTAQYSYQTFSYSYYKDRLPSIIQSDKGTKVEFTYNSSDQLVTRRFTLEGLFILQEDISYDDTGAIKRMVKSDGKGNISEKLSYTYLGQNPSVVTDSIMNGSETVSVPTYTFTVGTNLFQPLHLTTLLDPTRIDYIGFKNNVNVINISDSPSKALQFTNNNFNNKGYPVKLTGQKEGDSYTERYVFECQ